MTFFKKELFSSKLHLPSGHLVVFEEVGDDMGVIATEDAFLINELKKAQERHVGGVVEINAQQYTELKKNPPDKPSEPPWLSAQKLTLQRQLQAERQSVATANVVAEGAKASDKPVIIEGKEAASQAPKQSVPLEVPQSIPVLTKLGGRKSKTPPPASAPAT